MSEWRGNPDERRSTRQIGPWTDELIERLRKLWDEGYPTSTIGRMLGVSKNAVVGKAHRLDLTERPSPIKRRQLTPHEAVPAVVELRAAGHTNQQSIARQIGVHVSVVKSSLAMSGAATRLCTREPTLPPLSSVVAMPRPRAAMPRNEVQGYFGKCCWPIDQPPGTRPRYLYCDEAVTVKGPYCNKHRKDAYRPLPPRKEAA